MRFDITQPDYEEFRSIAVEHHLYASFICSNIGKASPEVIRNYKLQADQFRLLMERRPLSMKIIDELEKEGELNQLMAGFGRYLIQHELLL